MTRTDARPAAPPIAPSRPSPQPAAAGSTDTRLNRSLPRLAALAITVLGFGLRLHQLTFQPLWWDEGISLYLAALDPAQLLWAKDLDFDIHPPLYALLLNAWSNVAGRSVFAARGLSVLFGTLGLPLAYALTRRWLGPGAALLATLFAAVSPVLIHYSQEVRMYGLAPALALAALLVWQRANQRLDAGRPVPRGTAASWVALSALGLYTYYYLVWFVAAQVVAGGIAPRPWRRWLFWGVLGALAGALTLPWGLLLLRGKSGWWGNGVGQAPPPGLGPFLEVTWLAFSVGFTVVQPYTDLFAGLTLALALYGLALGPWRGRWTRLRGLLLALLPIACSFLMLQVRDFYFPRLVLPVTFLVGAFAGAGVAALGARQRLLGAFLMAGLLASSAFSLAHEWGVRRTAFAPGDYLTVLDTVRAEAGAAPGAGEAVLCAQAWQCGYALAYLAPGDPLAGPLRVEAVEPDWLRDEARLRSEAARLAGQYPRLWVISWVPDAQSDHREVERAVAASRPPLLIDAAGDTRVALFAAQPPLSGSAAADAAALGLRPLGARFGDAIELVGYRLDPPSGTGTLPPAANPLNLPAGSRPADLTGRSADLTGTPAPNTSAGTPAASPAGGSAPATAGRAGSELSLTVAWRALATPPADLTVFNQLLDGGEHIVAQRDAPPLSGAPPTSTWTPGALLIDRYTIPIPPDADPGDTTLVVGLYDPRTGARLATAGRDFVALAQIAIVR